MSRRHAFWKGRVIERDELARRVLQLHEA